MPNIPALAAPRFVRVGAYEIAYLEHNRGAAGAPLVFVHGLSMSVRFWELAMVAPIRDHRHWLSVSLPLHHPSRYHGDAAQAVLTTEDLFACLDAVVRAVVGERPVRVIGHSVGAFSALLFAARAPARCLGALAIGGFADGRAMEVAGALRWLARGGALRRWLFGAAWGVQQSSITALRAVVMQYAADQVALLGYAPFEPTLRLVYPDVARHRLGEIFAMVQWLADVDLTAEFAAIRVPVVMVAGDADPVVDFGHQCAVGLSVARGRVEVFRGAGHLVFGERDGQFGGVLMGFVWG